MTETGKSAGKTAAKKEIGNCTPKDQKASLTGLGFGRLGGRVVREDTPSLRGMIRKVRHLVEVTKG